MEQLNDEQLISECRAGNKRAWETLVRRYERLIYAVARRAGLNQEESADVFQQVFLLLVKNLSRIKQPSQIQAWLVTTARRETLQIFRQRKKHGISLSKDEDSENGLIENLADEAILADELIVKLETQNRVRTALNALEERCRELLKLLFYQEKPSYSEIAAKLSISEGSIGPTRARCLKKLLDLL